MDSYFWLGAEGEAHPSDRVLSGDAPLRVVDALATCLERLWSGDCYTVACERDRLRLLLDLFLQQARASNGQA